MKTLKTLSLTFCVAATALTALGQDGGAQPDEQAKLEKLSPQVAQQLGRMLARDWKNQPEWAQEMTALLQGRGMGMNQGWFRPSQTRYGWLWLVTTFDSNLDNSISADEFPNIDRKMLLFARLDRNRDGTISKADFGRPAFSRGAMMANELFYQWDFDSNGKVSKDEISLFFRAADQDNSGFVTTEDLTRALTPPPQPARSGGPPPRPSANYWLNMLLSGQLGSLTEGPKLGQPAPNFELATLDGKRRIKLSSYRGKKPVVLIFGSFT